MSLTLGIDTSSVLVVGLARDGEPLAGDRVDDTRAHAEQLMPLILRVLTAAGSRLSDLDRIAVGMGPGPFTGLRVGIATATTLAWARRLPCLRVCGLDVLARQAVTDGVVAGEEFLVTADARRREVYWARYDPGGRRLAGPEVAAPGELAERSAGVVVGPGAALYPDVFAGRWRDHPAVGGLDAARLAAWAGDLPDPGPAPLYLRRPDATLPTRRKSTLVVPTTRPRRAGERS